MHEWQCKVLNTLCLKTAAGKKYTLHVFAGRYCDLEKYRDKRHSNMSHRDRVRRFILPNENKSLV